MAKTKISKIAKDLNVALPTVIEFLRKKDITIDDNPNTRVEDDIVDILVKEFKNDKDQKSKSEQFSSERQKERTKPAQKETAKPVEEMVIAVEPTAQPKIVGKIDINNLGKPAAKAVINTPRQVLIDKADLEEDTVDEILEILKAEFED